jgi:hypothetical protein
VSKPDPSSIAQRITRESCVGLFADYGVTLAPAPPLGTDTNAAPLYVGLLGFTGEGVRGTLILGASDGPLAQSSRVRCAGLERQWIAELTNQLLGRIKTRFLSHGVTLHMAVPVALHVKHIVPLLRPPQEELAFRAAGGAVCAALDLELDEGRVLSPEPVTADVGLSAGNALMF